MHKLQQLHKTLVSLIPGVASLGMVSFYREGTPHNISTPVQRANLPYSQHLHQNISDSSGLDGSGDNGPAGGIGSELVQQPVLGAAAHNVNRLNP